MAKLEDDRRSLCCANGAMNGVGGSWAAMNRVVSAFSPNEYGVTLLTHSGDLRERRRRRTKKRTKNKTPTPRTRQTITIPAAAPPDKPELLLEVAPLCAGVDEADEDGEVITDAEAVGCADVVAKVVAGVEIAVVDGWEEDVVTEAEVEAEVEDVEDVSVTAVCVDGTRLLVATTVDALLVPAPGNVSVRVTGPVSVNS